MKSNAPIHRWTARSGAAAFTVVALVTQTSFVIDDTAVNAS